MEHNNTFLVEITFLGTVFKNEEEGHVKEDVTKTIKFKELDRTDSSQHLLHFLIASILEMKKGEGGAEDKPFIGYEKMYELAVNSVKTLMITGDGVTEADKTAILADSTALLNFGDWFAAKKALPFFLRSRANLVK